MTFSFAAGAVLTAAQMNALAPVYVIKQVTETVNNSTTLQNDDELALTFNTTGITYDVELRLWVGVGGTTSDIKTAWARTGTLTAMANRVVLGPQIATADATATLMNTTAGYALTSSVAYGCDGTHNEFVLEKFIIRVDVAGVLTLQWAQNAAVAVNTTVLAGSSLIATPIAM